MKHFGLGRSEIIAGETSTASFSFQNKLRIQ